MTVNRYGVDISYFRNWFDRSLRNLRDYKPDELARELARMSRAADSQVLLEPEFSNYQELLTELKACTEELQSWLNDQGDYGTEGYEEWLPRLRRLIGTACDDCGALAIKTGYCEDCYNKSDSPVG